ncbi:ECF transporter S component [[Clostridium] colinum]|uniref:ECF transporter S component n=1 Tax=[Clostridium] colinum TaxID=36835 RepID=UPI002025B5CC|nr:ECF transporter S component [[Clostridium] colinum]
MNNSLSKNDKKNFSKDIVKISLFSAIIFTLGMTPFGYIPLGAFKIVTVHIPVIIGSIVLGPKKGSFLGFIFGLTSFIMSHLQPAITSYFFSPIISGNIFSLIVCFIPRILVGIVPYFIFNLLKKINLNLSLIISGLVGSLVNTIFVLSFIYIFFAEKYAEILNTSLDNLIPVILASVGVNATLEAIASSILVLSICKAIFKISK